MTLGNGLSGTLEDGKTRALELHRLEHSRVQKTGAVHARSLLGNDALRVTSEGVLLETPAIQQRKVDVVILDTAAVLEKLPNRDSSNERMKFLPIFGDGFIERERAFPGERRNHYGAVDFRQRRWTPYRIQAYGLLGLHIGRSERIRANDLVLKDDGDRHSHPLVFHLSANKLVESLHRRRDRLRQAWRQGNDRPHDASDSGADYDLTFR